MRWNSGMWWFPGTASCGGGSRFRKAAAAWYCRSRARCVKSPLATSSVGLRPSRSLTSPSTTTGAVRPKWMSEMWARVRISDGQGSQLRLSRSVLPRDFLGVGGDQHLADALLLDAGDAD